MQELESIVQRALQEDMPQGDITTTAIADSATSSSIGLGAGKAKLVAKQNLVLSGCEIFEIVFRMVDPQVKIIWKFNISNIQNYFCSWV